jgi:hypothetical protein
MPCIGPSWARVRKAWARFVYGFSVNFIFLFLLDQIKFWYNIRKFV